jgi:hypothetical protein
MIELVYSRHFQIPLIETRTNKVVIGDKMEDESVEIKEFNLGMNDPCYALFRFQHADAPSPNKTKCKELLNWYDEICESDSLDQESPGERMIGKMFNVLCWKSTRFAQCNNAFAGTVYAVEIKDAHGFGSDGFFIEELGMYIDTVVLAMDHFIVA